MAIISICYSRGEIVLRDFLMECRNMSLYIIINI